MILFRLIWDLSLALALASIATLLFLITLLINVISQWVLARFREVYD